MASRQPESRHRPFGYAPLCQPQKTQPTHDEGGRTLRRLNRRKDQRTRSIIRNRRKVPIAALLALFSGTVPAVALTQTATGASARASVVPSAAAASCAWPVSFNITN